MWYPRTAAAITQPWGDNPEDKSQHTKDDREGREKKTKKKNIKPPISMIMSSAAKLNILVTTLSPVYYVR